MSYRSLLGFSIFANMFAAIHFVTCIGMLVIGAGPNGYQSGQFAIVWIGLGGLSLWLYRILKGQSLRMDQLELELRNLRAANQTPAMTASLQVGEGV